MRTTTQRKRKDHFVPQGYLRGFIDQAQNAMSKPLWVFDVKSGSWSERSPSEVGWERGFYDYPVTSDPVEMADEAFAGLEREFPKVRDNILAEGFEIWPMHKDLLLRYGQMLRARSILFREQSILEFEKSTVLTLTGRGPEEFVPKDEQEKKRLAKNKAITDVREEIRKGSAWFNSYDWALRFTTDPKNPVITGDQCIVVDGRAPDLPSALTDPETVILFPLSWQMCLIGALGQFDDQTAPFFSADLRRMRTIYAQETKLFLISPTKLEIAN